jgi:hypothetical protein
VVAPVFRGLHSLLRVVNELLNRPKWSRVAKAGLRGDRPLPLICLIGASRAEKFVTVLAQHLEDTAPPNQLFAEVDMTAAGGLDNTEHGAALVPLLEVLRDRLTEDRFGDQRIRRFRYFNLVNGLTRQQAGVDPAELFTTWRGRRRADTEQPPAQAMAALPAWAQALVAVFVAWHRPLRFWLWSHRVWPFGREPRWLMRQRFMVPGHSTSFIGFAERLTSRSRDAESLDELKKLLVHAFLQDLRLTYGAGTFRLRRWRRTAYVLVLLNTITEDNGGWELLRLINDVRNESTEHDPLLVVATSPRLPGWLARTRAPQPAYRTESELDAWLRRLPAGRQSLSDDARFITIRLPATDDNPPSDVDESAWSTLGRIRPRPAPVPARRSVVLMTAVVVLAVVAATAGTWLWPRIQGNCLPSPRSGVAVQWLTNERSGECIGYSDNASQLFGDDERMLAAQRAIFELNDKAEEFHTADPRRPLVSIVYFSELTRPVNTHGSADSVTEQLIGLLLQQARANVRNDRHDPLLRVIVANGGYEMRQARRVVDELLAPLFEADASVMGVVGMGRTTDPVESAIGALGDLGVPVVATTLTGEGLAERSPVYFQLVPGNRAQAELVKTYVARQGKPIDIYRPRNTAGDGYLRSLHHELAQRFGDIVFRDWDGDVATVKATCGTDRIAFFAGRQTEFREFLDRILAECADNLPTIIGDDTVARFVAQADNRNNPAYAGKSIMYVSLSSEVVLENQSCLAQTQPAQAKADHVTPLCSGLRALREPKQTDGAAWRAFGALLDQTNVPWIGERVGLSYDSAGLFLHAAAWNQENRNRIDPSGQGLNRTAISHELRELSCPTSAHEPRANCYDGASGEIDFHAGRAGESRPIALLRLPDVKDVAQPPTCVLELPAGSTTCTS